MKPFVRHSTIAILVSVLFLILFFVPDMGVCEEGYAAAKSVTVCEAIAADDQKSVDIIWKKASGADRYLIYRATSKNGTYTRIGTAKSGSTCFTDTDVKLYKTYWYKIRYEAKGVRSSYSVPVSAYIGDEVYFADPELKVKIVTSSGKTVLRDSGDGMATNTYDVTLIPQYKGKTLKDYSVYYDKGSLQITKKSDGKLRVKVLKTGKHVITFSSKTVKGTFIYNAEKRDCDEYFTFFWKGRNEEEYPSTYKYPIVKQSVLYVHHNRKDVSNFTVKSSDPKIASVTKSGNQITVSNHKTGSCTITISNGTHSSVYTWVVRRGEALTRRAVNGIPVSADISLKKAQSAVETILDTDHSKKQIKAYAAKNLSLKEWKDILSKPADVMQMLWALNFNQNTDDKIDNQNIRYGEYNWCSKLSPEGNYAQRYVVCLSVSEMMNYLLQDDMEEQGYVLYSSPDGGHAFCYYKVNGLYVFCDFVDSVAMQNCPFENYVVYVTDSKEDFAKYYLGSSAEHTAKKAGGYIYMLYMYPMEGRAVPTTEDGAPYAYPGCSVADIFPKTWKGKNIEDIISILYTAPGFKISYVEEPPEEIWTF